MRIGITGATGFIGRVLVRRAAAAGHRVAAFSRNESADVPGADEVRRYDPAGDMGLGDFDAVIHLAGEPVLGRWTQAKKDRIIGSRVEGTRGVVAQLPGSSSRPGVFLCASAIGIYGSRGDEILSEASPVATGFLADVARAWEREAGSAAEAGIRVVTPRIGFVMGRGSPAAKMLRMVFSAGLGGVLGSGKQWMSWVHAEDVAGIFLHAMENESIEGAINAVSPNPVRNAEFTRAIADAVRRPAFLPAPSWALKALLGEASELLLASQRVNPERAQETGYVYGFPEVGGAAREMLISQ